MKYDLRPLNTGDKVICVDNLSAAGTPISSIRVGGEYEVLSVVAPGTLGQQPSVLGFTLKEFGDHIFWSADRFVKASDFVLSANEYQNAAMRTAAGAMRAECEDSFDFVLMGALGLAGETGEVVELVKKYLYQGHDLPKEKIADELGDVCWYLAVLAKGIGYDLETIMKHNIEKLKRRYPKGFEPQNSLNRKEQ